jgi:D-alanyl-lipoteichoic acid acyltransferase DltB (MBOAT superfamily)
MLFNSPVFIFLFLPITLIGFFRIAALGQRRVAEAWLVATSLFFYGWWNPAYLGLILASILANYGLGAAITSSRNTRRRKAILVVGITANLAAIAYFKYANFFVANLNALGGSSYVLGEIILPLGISFFTFTQIAYLVDTYRREAKEYDFLHYILFVTFFPHLIAGPIVHHYQLIPQFARSEVYRFSAYDFTVGLGIFCIGLFKKVVIADRFALSATPVFSAAETGIPLGFFDAWKGAFSYTFQLYFDFSGYSDMAIGLSRMFGIWMPANFDSPYRAVNIVDFWRRWHMTLSQFLRDYLYVPLGGNRYGRARRYLNLMVTMLLGGLWHGAGWNFVIWGALHGFYLVVNHAWDSIKPGWLRRERWWSLALARLLTLLAVTIAWVFFRAHTLGGATSMFSGMTNLPQNFAARLGPFADVLGALGFRFQGEYMVAANYQDLAWLVVWIGIVWFVPNTQQIFRSHKPALDQLEKPFGAGRPPPAPMRGLGFWQWRPTWGWALVLAVVSVFGALSLFQVSEFLYFQF